MIFTLVVFILTCLLMILSILFFPKIRIKKIELDTYWLITILGCLVLLIGKVINFSDVASSLTQATSMNPLEILILFFSMAFLSIFLDEVGFFEALANAVLSKTGTSQRKLFFAFYFMIAILTIFTSNDIIILTFTPFICYFSKAAKINPLPYLFSEFIAANTWSMMLIIGNPTNIYLASLSSYDFFTYFKQMILPTLASGILALLILLLLFHKELRKPMEIVPPVHPKLNHFLVILGLAHLFLCTITLSISSFLMLSMWIISLGFAVSLLIWLLIYDIIKKQKNTIGVLKRLPYSLAPFLLSMFVLVHSLQTVGITGYLADKISTISSPYFYAFVSSFLTPLLNNIPMSVLMGEILSPISFNSSSPMLATIIGSNIGAFIAPTSSLAGIMWLKLLKKQGIHLSFLEFSKIGLCIVIPILLVCCLLLG